MSERGYNTSSLLEAAKRPEEGRLGVTQPARELSLRVTSVSPLSVSTYAVALTPVGAPRLERYPGQYIELLAPSGQRVPFSIANAPTAEGEALELHIACAARGSTSFAILQGLHNSDWVRAYGPKGHTYVMPPARRPLALVASGTGFAQSKAIIEAELHSGSGARMFLYWKGNRNTGIYMRELVREWSSCRERFGYLTRPRPASLAQEAHDCARQVSEAFAGGTDYDLIVSGSDKFVNEIAETFMNSGLPRSRIHSDLLTRGAVPEASNGG